MSTKIQWTNDVWNPVVGCTQISSGCARCYAKSLHDKRHKAYQAGKKMPMQYSEPFEVVQLMPERLTVPLHWKQPRMIFVNSVSDLFHKDVPFEFIDKVFAVMALCPQHTFQVLTKRPERMAEYFADDDRGDLIANQAGETFGCGVYDLPHTSFDLDRDEEGKIHAVEAFVPLPNIWLGTSVENLAALSRIDALADCPAATYFVSFEPLLEDLCDISAKLRMLIWAAGNRPERVLAIIGGESGPKARPCNVEWIRSIVRQCAAANVPVFVKQLGAKPIINYYDDFREEYESRGNDWQPAIGWSYRDGQPPIGSKCELKLKDPKGGNPEEWPSDLRVRQMPEVKP